MDRLFDHINDRFGKIPVELENLFKVVRLRNLGISLGFEKIIVKNGMLIAFFISNPMSPYYSSDEFARVMQGIGDHPGIYNLKQVDSKLKIVSRPVDSLDRAISILSKLG